MSAQTTAASASFESLISCLDEMAAAKAKLDASQLAPRKVKEMEFHDVQRATRHSDDLPKDVFEKLHGNKKFYSTIQLVTEYVDGWMAAKVPGKVFVDYACGTGGRAIRAAQLGAKLVIGIDLSDVSLEKARIAAAEAGVADRCRFIQADCENTGLPENSIDVILCSGVLHHLDLSYAFPELRRILRPGGVVLASEALDYNPVIKLYRHMTPSMRTEWERNHILSMKDVCFGSRFFKVGDVKFWHLFSILAVVFRRSEALKSAALKVFNALDSIVMQVPFLQRMAWMFTFELYKKHEE